MGAYGADLATIFTLGIIGYVGDLVLNEMGKPKLAVPWNLALYGAAAVIALKAVRRCITFVETTFHIL